jgi:siroheme synthase-like protein
VRTFPIALKLEGLRVLVVGDGELAETKAAALGDAGALVIRSRSFRPEDLDDCWLAVSASSREENRRVAEEARARRVFALTVDEPALSTAYGVAVVRRGGVTLAISTDGEAPALAALVREALERLLPEELERWTETARSLRREWKESGAPFSSRRPLLLRALNELYAEGRE